MNAGNKIKVLVVDDSAVIRQVFTDIIAEDRSLELMATARDPLVAMELMKKAIPDVLIVDIEMPRMDGLTFLRKQMAERPIPTIICSTLTQKGTRKAFEAMDAGAVEVMAKPTLGARDFFKSSAQRINAVIKSTAKARVMGPARRPPASPTPAVKARGQSAAAERPTTLPGSEGFGSYLIAIGASTGGTRALEEILVRLRPPLPPIVVVQHMPEAFTATFADRLNQVCALKVSEAKDGDAVTPGRVLIAPGNFHMRITGRPGAYNVILDQSDRVNLHRPSVDPLFNSVAERVGDRALGIMLTGMGNDGAYGMLAMHQAGARTYAQDEASCVVYGMPKEAVKLGGVDKIIPLDKMHIAINQFRTELSKLATA